MTLFWLSTVLFVVVAMFCIAWPLNQLAQTRLTKRCFNKSTNNTIYKQSNLTPEQKWLMLLAITIPLNAYLFYALWGNLDELKLSNAIERSVMVASKQDRQVAQQAVIKLLEKQTTHYSNDFKRWYLLGEFYIQTHQYKNASDAFGHAVSVQPNDADALAQYAQALYFAGNNKLTFAITSTAEQALKINPNQLVALGLMGITAFENKRYREALGHWQKIVWMLGEQNTGSQSAQKGIELAKSLLKKQSEWAFVEVDVDIDPGVVATSSKWVLVYARQPRVTNPIAIVRVPVSDLPKRITLDDAAIVPHGVLLSSFDAIEVVAELSESTSTTPSTVGKHAVSPVISPSIKGARVELVIK